VIADRKQDRDLPFLPTLLCLWSAGSIASFVTSMVFLGRAYPPSGPSPVIVVANLLLSAAIGAVLFQLLLRSVVDYEIPYGATVVALVAGSSASTVVQFVCLHGLGGGASTALRPVAAIPFLPSFVGGVISWWLLQNGGGPQAPSTLVMPPSAAAEHPVSRQMQVFGDPHAGDPTASAYAETISAVRESTLGLVGAVNSVAPASAPTVIAEGLVPYEAATRRLEQAELPGSVSADLNQRLVEALKQLEEDLALTADEAATTAGSSLYQPGFLTPSMADVSDGGGRYRWELEESEGLRAVKQALSDLGALGFGHV
jgi:hypothetical protein